MERLQTLFHRRVPVFVFLFVCLFVFLFVLILTRKFDGYETATDKENATK